MFGLKLAKFSVLRYVPDENREEFINIGLVFHCPEESFLDIKLTTNFSRVMAFDDEIEIGLLKLILQGIREDLTQALLSGPSSVEIGDINYLEKYTRHFVNQLQFSPVEFIRTDNIELDFQNLFRTYVYFDVHKKKRITDDEVKVILNKVLRSNDALNKLEKNFSVDIGAEEIQLDYAYKTKNRLKIIKTFSFDYADRKSSQATQTAKEWAYNFDKLKKNNKRFDTNRTDFITLVYIDQENKNIKTAIQILGEETEMFQARGIDQVKRFASNIVDEVEFEWNGI